MNLGLLAAKVALAPVLLPQSGWVRRHALRLPEAAGPRSGTVGAGVAAVRLLVVGDSSAAGVGVADQAQALALPLAHSLAGRLRARVRWQLVAQTGINTSEARALLAKVALQPADVVVSALGVNDVSSQTPAPRFVRETELLWSRLRDVTGARWAVFNGLPPMHMLHAVPNPLRWYLGRYARWLDAALCEWAAQRDLGYCALQWTSDPAMLADDGFHPGPRLYPEWAGRLVELLVQGRALWAAPSPRPVEGRTSPSGRPETVEGPG
jgi:lysophospholipase L1-like esterase